MINYILLVSRQGKLRLSKWYATVSSKTREKVVRDVTQLVLARRQRVSNFLEYRGKKIVYRRYASLFFICEIGEADNELVTLEVLHRFVEVLDQYFGNVCEMDLIFNFRQAYNILDEVIIAGELLDSSKSVVLTLVRETDAWEQTEATAEAIKELLLT